MNWSLFESSTPVMIQGITGKEGARMASWLRTSRVNVVCGVTPGKAGQTVEGIPVFDNVAAACAQFSEVMISSIVAPPTRVLGAVEEAIRAGIRLVHILTESIPVHDVMRMRTLASEVGAILLGPSSVGYLQFPRFRIGYLGGTSPFEVLREGGFGVVSTSGGMTNEILMALAREGMGVRMAFALGGDRIVGTTPEQAMTWCDAEDQVSATILFVEPGRQILSALASGALSFRKPMIVFLAGMALDDLPKGQPYGHTGTILGEGDMTVRELGERLLARGVPCVHTMSELLTVSKTYAS